MARRLFARLPRGALETLPRQDNSLRRRFAHPQLVHMRGLPDASLTS